MADNMFFQCIPAIQIGVQREFKVSNSQLGLLNTFMLFGLLIGASGWGLYSDINGRRPCLF